MPVVHTSEDSLCSSPTRLQHPLNRYPASRWQQLKQSISIAEGGSTKQPTDQANHHPAYSSTSLSLGSQVRSGERNAAEASHDGPAAAAALQQEVADVLRRCAGTGAALHTRDVHAAASLLAWSPSQPANADQQFHIQPDGSISCWQPGQLKTSPQPVSSYGPGSSRWLGSSTAALYLDEAPEAEEATAAELRLDSIPAADRLPPRPVFHKQQHKQQRSMHGIDQHSPKKQQQRQQPLLSKSSTFSSSSTSKAPCTKTTSQLLRKQPVAGKPAQGRNLSSSYAASWGSSSSYESNGNSSSRGLYQADQPSNSKSTVSTPLLPRSATVDPAAVAAASGVDAGRAAAGSLAASHTGHDSALLHQLQHDLAVALALKVLRRWQQAAADVALDKARARPMAKLLSKRKALRAWKTATWQQAPEQTPADEALVDSGASGHSYQQPIGIVQAQQQLQQLTRREHVAVQFHRLYWLHGCLMHWRGAAAAAALARQREQDDRFIEEQQARVLQQQKQQEFKKQREQLKQQEQARLAIAIQFHRLFVLHRAVNIWHKNASISAALSKLYPPDTTAAGVCRRAPVGPLGNSAVPAGSSAAAGSCRGRSSSAQCAAVAGPGNMDTAAVVQLKAQQLLQRLAGKQQQQQQMQQVQAVPGAASGAVVVQGQQHKQHEELHQQQQQQCVVQQPVRCEQAPCALLVVQAQQQLSQGQVQTPGEHCNTDPASGEHAERAAASGSASADAELLLRCIEGLSCAGSQLPAAAATGSDSSKCDAAAAAAAADAMSETCGSSNLVECSSREHRHAAAAAQQQRDEQQPLQQPEQQQEQDGKAGRHDKQQQQQLDEEGHQEQQDLAIVQLQEQQQCPGQQEIVGKPTAQQLVDSQGQRRAVEPQPAQNAQPCQLTSSCTGQRTGAKQPHHHQQQQQQQRVLYTQQTQQQLRQLLAAEQRKQREEQLLQQQLQQELAAQQAALASMHYQLVLVSRLGLGPWKALLSLRRQQEQLAGSWRGKGLLKAAMLVWKQLLTQRHKRRTCSHVRAFGMLRKLRQQHQQHKVLAALAAWALTSRQYRRQLLLRCLGAWRQQVAATQLLLAEARDIRLAGVKRGVVKAWRQFTEDQAQEQVLLEIELQAVAANWRRRRQQQQVLSGWRIAAAAAIQERQQHARRQETWGKVRGWLSELEASKRAGSVAVGSAAVGASDITSAAAAAGSCVTSVRLSQVVPAWEWEDDCGGGLSSPLGGDDQDL